MLKGRSFVAHTFEFSTVDKDEYERLGFVCWQALLSWDGLKTLREGSETVLEDCDPRADKEWIMNLHQLLPVENNWMWTLANEPKIVAAVQRCLKSKEVVLYCSQLAVRQGHSRTYTPWHQDGEGGSVCTMWICLDRVSPKNGGLRVLSGQHKSRQEYKPVSSEAELEVAVKYAKHNVFECACEKREIRSYRLRAGGAGLHHAFLPHSTLPNDSGTDRRVIILRYMLAIEPRVEGYLPDYRNIRKKFKRSYPMLGSNP